MNYLRLQINYIIFSLSILLPCSLFTGPRKTETRLLDVELKELLSNAESDYINLDKETSKIYDIIVQLLKWDKDTKNSLLYKLKKHIENGFFIGEYNSVVEVLEYAESILNKNYKNINSKEAKRIKKQLNRVIEQITNKQLIINAQKIAAADSQDNNDVSQDKISIEEKVSIQKEASFDAGLNLNGGDNNVLLENRAGINLATEQLGTVVSSIQFKTKVNRLQTMESERIYNLNPVTFVYKEDSSGTKQYGLIAEDVAQVFPELVVSDSEGKPFTVRYQLLPVLLLNEIQRLNNLVQEQGMNINTLKTDNKRLNDMIKDILNRLK